MALEGMTVVELAGLAPSPQCGMILADFGATVIRIDRTGTTGDGPLQDTLCRGKFSIAINLKHEEGRVILRKLCRSADVLIEPFRRGVMERLGLGPDTLLADNPRLVYARMTGYGQTGPLAMRAGHDINYIAISGLLSMLGRRGENPCPPVNLLGDFGGGGMICALGILVALLERVKSGRGQIIDANMVEGANYMSTFLWTTRHLPTWGKERGENWLDTGAPWYETYKTADGQFMAVGAIEPQFYATLLKGLGLAPTEAPQFGDWSKLKVKLHQIFATKTQEEWCAIFDDVDACVTPVVPWQKADEHPHNKTKGSFRRDPDNAGTLVPMPAPLLSRTPSRPVDVATFLSPGLDTQVVLRAVGYADEEIKKLLSVGAVDYLPPTEVKVNGVNGSIECRRKPFKL